MLPSFSWKKALTPRLKTQKPSRKISMIIRKQNLNISKHLISGLRWIRICRWSISGLKMWMDTMRMLNFWIRDNFRRSKEPEEVCRIKDRNILMKSVVSNINIHWYHYFWVCSSLFKSGEWELFSLFEGPTNSLKFPISFIYFFKQFIASKNLLKRTPSLGGLLGLFYLPNKVPRR